MLGISLTLGVLLLLGVSGADPERESVSVIEGDSVTLNTDIQINQKDRIKWFLNGTRIAQIIGNISNCTDIHCNEGTERFRDRLKLDHLTGSLTIMNTRNTHSGEYMLEIFTSSKTDRLKIFNVTISAVPNPGPSPAAPSSGPSPGVVAGISVTAVLLVSAAAGIGAVIYCRKRQAGQNDIEMDKRNQNTANGTSHTQNDPLLENPANGTSHTQNDPLLLNPANGTSP